MKYSYYCKSLAQRISEISYSSSALITCTKEVKKHIEQNDFYEVCISAYHMEYYCERWEELMKKLERISRMITVPKSFVENQPKGVSAMEIGEKYLRGER